MNKERLWPQAASMVMSGYFPSPENACPFEYGYECSTWAKHLGYQ